MGDLTEDKKRLKEGLAKKGITYVLKYLKEMLPTEVPKYDVLIQIEGEYRDVKMKMLEGLLSQEAIEQANARIRRRIIDFINSLEPEDFIRGAKGSQFEEQGDIKKGHILYQVPGRMKLNEEARCLVRIAFDKAALVDDIDINDDTELRSEVRISDYMKVEIIDPSATPVFVIRSTSEPIQFIDLDDYTEWRFYVKPLQAGKHILELKVNVILLINEREVLREKTLEESVMIIAEDVPEEEPAFKQLEDSFIAGGGGSPATDGAIEVDAHSGGSGIPKGVRLMAFLLVGVFGIASASYALVPSVAQQMDWAMVNNVQQTEASYSRFINKYEKKLPESDLLETAYYKKAIVQDSPDALRNYIEKYPTSRYQEEATWELAERTKDPLDYLDYADRFEKTPRTETAKEKIINNEEVILDKVKEKKDSSAVELLDKYLRVVPERKKSENLKPVIRELEPVIKDVDIKNPSLRNLQPVLEQHLDKNILERERN